MTLEDAIAEGLEDMISEVGGFIPSDKVSDLAKAIAHGVGCFNEIASYGRPSGGDMIKMHVEQATKPLLGKVDDLEKRHESRFVDMRRERDEWRAAFYRLRDGRAQ
jgi:hypothetical protein